LRFAVLGMPWFLNGAWFSGEVLMSPLVYVLAVVVFGVGFSIVYLFLFNRPTRQSLHDLAVSSYVVQLESTNPIATSPTGRVHVGVVAVLLVAASSAPFFTSRLVSKEPFAALLDVYRVISAEPGIVHANLNKGWSSSAAGEITYLQVIAYLAEPGIDDTETAGRLARLAIKTDPSAMNLDTVQVTLVYGYDIGLASAHKLHSHSDTQARWLAAGE
jgi:hypothetical protein